VDIVYKKRIVGNSIKTTSSDDLKDLLIKQVSTQIKHKRTVIGLP